jgi:hypothetical protein
MLYAIFRNRSEVVYTIHTANVFTTRIGTPTLTLEFVELEPTGATIDVLFVFYLFFYDKTSLV